MHRDIDRFIEYMKRETNDSLKALEKKESDLNFPIIKPGVQNLLMILLELTNPEYILEIGTGVGFSSILMATSSKTIKEITTIELKEKNYKRALENINDFGLNEIINPILGDAEEVLKSGSIQRKYDFIFMDAAKGQYPAVWKYVKELIRPGGIVLTDDVLQNHTVCGSRFLLNRRDRTIHNRMRKFLHTQLNDSDFTGSIFEIDDGISLLVRNTDEK